MLSLFAESPIPIRAQEDDIFNFEITLLTNPNLLREGIANYVKSALSPLGIKVNIQVRDFQAYVAILGDEFDNIDAPDLSINSYLLPIHAPLLPEVSTNFPITTTNGGDELYHLNDPGWRDWQLEDVGIDQDDIDDLFWSIQREFDLTKHRNLVNQMSNMFMKDLLYFLPTLHRTSYQAVPNYLNGWIPQLGPVLSMYKGMQINNNPANRNYDDQTFVQGFGISPSVFPVRPTEGQLFIRDENANPHPDLAIQWELTDWEVNETVTIPNGKNIFKIRNDAYWFKPHKDALLNFTSTEYPISAKDFAFRFQMEALLDPYIRENYDVEIDDENNIFTVYSRNPMLLDQDVILAFTPWPEFYLNNTAHFNEMNETIIEFADLGIPFFVLDEFQQFFSNPLSSGAFFRSSRFRNIISGQFTSGGSDILRPDYWYPNEWDSPNQDFLVHLPGPEDPVFFTYNTTDISPQQKPTKLYFNNYTWWNPGELDFNTRSESFCYHYNRGLIDTFNVDIAHTPVSLLEELINNEELNMLKYINNESGEKLNFNLRNPHLRKINVRRAISYALDKKEMIQVIEGYTEEWNSIVWLSHQPWYSNDYAVQPDYALARDLMKSEGYKAADTNEFRVDIPPIPTNTIFVPEDELGNNFLIIYVIMAISFRAYLRKRIN